MESYTVTVLLLGDEKVGKSTFLSRMSMGAGSLEGAANPPMLRDIDQPFIFELRNRKAEFRLELFDTSSPTSWRLLEPDMVIMCYDISSRPSLLNVQKVWINEVRATFKNESTLPILLLGLKRDLRRADDPNGTIYPQEGYKMAQEIRADKYAECSASSGELFKLAFEEVCRTAAGTTKASGGQSEGGCLAM